MLFSSHEDPQGHHGAKRQSLQILILHSDDHQHVGHCAVHCVLYLCIQGSGKSSFTKESLMLFIIPAFLLCLLFTNLQPRLMIFIFQSFTDNNVNIRRMLCRFNLFHYGSLFSIYPILMLTNLNWVLFIGMSCMLFPQIYANGFINIRPDIASPYYLKYILSRFFLIVLASIFSSISRPTPITSSAYSLITSSASSAYFLLAYSTGFFSYSKSTATKKLCPASYWSLSSITN